MSTDFTDTENPWAWLNDHFHQGVDFFGLQLTEDGKHYWVDGRGYLKLTQVKTPV